jgi:hypothetical protein
MTDAPVLQVEGLVKHFPIHGGLLQRQVGAVRAEQRTTRRRVPASRLGHPLADRPGQGAHIDNAAAALH